MTAPKLRVMAATAAVSMVTTAYATRQRLANEDEDSKGFKSAIISTSPRSFPTEGFLASAERILEATGDEVRRATEEFKLSKSFQDTRVRAIVAARFVDLLSRSAFAIFDYKLFSLLDEPLDEVHQRTAKLIHDACALHGGILVKVGQYMATNAGGFLPEAYKEALRPLLDSCAPLPIEEIELVVEEELEKLLSPRGNKSRPLWKEVFLHIHPEPLGSASLAQVHAATLADGRKVAIKVQRPNLDATTKADLVALQLLSKAVERAFPGTGIHWMLPEFQKTIVAELDFTQEATNAERCDRLIRGTPLHTDTSLWGFLAKNGRQLFLATAARPPHTIVPKPIRELTTPRMLTMSFEEGFRVTDTQKLKQHRIDPKCVAAASCSLFAELMFVHGFVYADCHPGNVLVRPRLGQPGEFDLVLLDHGMYRRLDEKFRASYCRLWAGLVSGNDRQALAGVRGLGFEDKYLDLMGLILTYRIPSGVVGRDSFLSRHKLGSVMSKSARGKVKDYLRDKFGENVLTPAGINNFMESQSRDLLYCLRCTHLVRGMNRELGGTSLDRFIAFGSAASRGVSIPSAVDSLQESATPFSSIEADWLTLSNDEMLERVKKALNLPVASELLSKERAVLASSADDRVLFPRTLSNFIQSYHISVRNWWKTLLLDLIIMIGGASVELSPRQLG